MQLKRNLIIGSRILAAGTDLASVPEALRSQIPADELEGGADVPQPSAAVEVAPKPVTPAPPPPDPKPLSKRRR
jgi:hypothetical protein